MTATTSRRTALAAGAGLLAGAALPRATVLAAISSAAGVVAGGSIEGPNGTIQFSAFASNIRLDDSDEIVTHASFTWFDPTGADGEPMTLTLAAVDTYGPVGVDRPNARRITGTVAVNGEGEEPFVLELEDNGEIGVVPDTLAFTLGTELPESAATPVPVDSETGYTVTGELTSGDVALIIVE